MFQPMNDNAAAAENSCRVSLIATSHLVIVDQCSVAFVPDLDAECVRTAAPVDPAINGSDDKAIVAAAVYPPTALVLRFRSADQHPVVACAVKIDAAHFELKLGLPGWHISPVLILRNKPERGFSGQQRIRGIRARWRIDPPTSGYPLATLVRNELTEFLNAYVDKLAYVNVEQLVYGHRVRAVKLTVCGTEAAPFLDKVSTRVEFLNSMAVLVSDVNITK